MPSSNLPRLFGLGGVTKSLDGGGLKFSKKFENLKNIKITINKNKN